MKKIFTKLFVFVFLFLGINSYFYISNVLAATNGNNGTTDGQPTSDDNAGKNGFGGKGGAAGSDNGGNGGAAGVTNGGSGGAGRGRSFARNGGNGADGEDGANGSSIDDRNGKVGGNGGSGGVGSSGKDSSIITGTYDINTNSTLGVSGAGGSGGGTSGLDGGGHYEALDDHSGHGGTQLKGGDKALSTGGYSEEGSLGQGGDSGTDRFGL